jgi:hypothetical protein
MKLDTDLIREILLKIEESPKFSKAHGDIQKVTAASLGITDHNEEQVAYHCAQLVDAGFLTGNTKMAAHGLVMVGNLTWSGHEFLNDARDPDVWQKTKERAKGVASVGLGFLWEIAKAEMKTKLGLP